MVLHSQKLLFSLVFAKEIQVEGVQFTCLLVMEFQGLQVGVW